MSFVKRVISGGQEAKCSRCEKSLGLISRDPDDTWGFNGKLCNDCYSQVKKGIQEYEVFYLGGYSKLPIELEGWLFVHIFDDRNKVIFKPKKKSEFALQIPSDLLLDCKIITRSETSMKKTIMTAGLLKSSDKKYLQIDFTSDQNKTESAIFEVKDKLDEANNTIYLLKAKRRDEQESEAETEPLMEQKTFCTNCGTANDIEARFCSKCGNKLFDESSTDSEEPINHDYDAAKEKAYFKGEGEIIVRRTEHRGAGRKIGSWLVAGPIGYVAVGRDKTRKSKAEGTLVVTNRAIYCAGNIYPYDKVLAITRKGKSIHLLFEKDFNGQRFSVTLELKTKDIDGLFRALETARMGNIQF